MRLGRRPFRELVERQLDLFAADEADLLAEAREADMAWTNAARDDTEELYGDYQLAVDAVGEHLYDLRETYAATVEDADAYRAEFDRTARRRFPRLTVFLDES